MRLAAESAVVAGIMSGTSADAADAAIASFTHDTFTLLGSASVEFSPDLRQEIIALNSPVDNELARSQLLGIQLSRSYADALAQALVRAGITKDALLACAVHGQTIRHQAADGYSLQIVNLALLAELIGVAVVGDFRSRDIAAGGQGAPLACGFHQWVFQSQAPCAVLNLGGFANLTLLYGDRDPVGFDCGPANVLLDGWIDRHLGRHYDTGGNWAATGKVQPVLLRTFQQHRFFGRSVPKSTGREDFSLAWLDTAIAGRKYAPEDVQATLIALTSWSIADSLRDFPPHAPLLLCGGGVSNHTLVQSIEDSVRWMKVVKSDTCGVPSRWMESLAFAWLGWQHCLGACASIPAVTGASGSRMLGCYYPA